MLYLSALTVDMLLYLICVIVYIEKSCPAPESVENAIQSGEYTYGSTVVYTCLRGYHRSAGGHHIVCNNGTWQGTKPTCTSECGKLEIYSTKDTILRNTFK